MDKIKTFLKSIKYRFLRLPIIKSIVKWMFKLYINPDPQSQEIHIVKNRSNRTSCGLMGTADLQPIKGYAMDMVELGELLEDYKTNKLNMCRNCVPYF